MSDLIHKTETGVQEYSEAILDELRSHWGAVELTTKKYVKDGDLITLQDVVVEVETPLVRLNKGYPNFGELFHQLAGVIKKADDFDRVIDSIRNGVFDVGNAIKAFVIAREFQNRLGLVPKSWEHARQLMTPSMVTLAVYRGAPVAEAIVFKMVTGLSDKFGRRSDIKDEGLRQEMSQYIVINYPNMTMADLRYAFSKIWTLDAKRPQFNLDYATIVNYIDKMNNERMETVASLKTMDVPVLLNEDNRGTDPVIDKLASLGNKLSLISQNTPK